MNGRTHADKTSAEKKSIGFDFQYYFFLWKLLTLNKGQSVGLEVKDDVHTELEDDIQIFYQVKHTLQLNASGDPINMTSADKDLWKTLYNWTKVITDENADRQTISKQLEFVKKSHFVMWSNKGLSDSNSIIQNIESLQTRDIDINEFITEVTGI